MEDLATITVDGLEMKVPKGTLLWEACKAHGIDIPIFCYHTKLGPVGACRTCLVESEGPRGTMIITACSTEVTDGMVVRTRSPGVQKAQRGIFEFLLANHPLDCPICDRGGECPLQDQTFAYGPGSSRYVEPKRHHVKPIVLGPTIALDRERCVLCWRCVRFCAEVAEDHSIVLLDRGDHSVVGTFQDEPYVSNFSGNVVELCPVGALTSRKQRFNFRPWELQNRPSVCPHCAFGCNINLSVRKNDEVIRFLSRDNPEVDDSWLCDRGRYDYEFINSPERLKSPLLRQGNAFVQAPWGDALSVIATRLRAIMDDEERGPGSIHGLASPRLTNEDLFVFKRFVRDVIGSPSVDHLPRPQTSLTGAQEDVLKRLRQRVAAISDLDGAKTIVLLGADPSRREPVMELRIRLAVNRHGANLVVFNPEEIALSSKAQCDVRYPAQRLEALATALAGAVGAARGSGSASVPDGLGIDRDGLTALAETYLKEGPVVLLYDDSFEGVVDTGSALQAVADLADALGTGGAVGVIPLLDDCNSMGARDLRVLPGEGWGAPSWQTMFASGGPPRAALVFGANPVQELGVRERPSGLDFLVVSELMLTETARLADVVLPAASFAEKLGTFTNTEGRVQMVRPAVPTPGMARADWEILVDLSQYFDRPLDYGLPSDVWDAIRAEVSEYNGINYNDIGAMGVRPLALQAV